MHRMSLFEYILKRNHDIGRRYTEVENVRYYLTMLCAGLRSHCPNCLCVCRCCPQNKIEDVHQHDHFHRHHVVAAGGHEDGEEEEATVGLKHATLAVFMCWLSLNTLFLLSGRPLQLSHEVSIFKQYVPSRNSNTTVFSR